MAVPVRAPFPCVLLEQANFHIPSDLGRIPSSQITIGSLVCDAASIFDHLSLTLVPRSIQRIGDSLKKDTSKGGKTGEPADGDNQSPSSGVEVVSSLELRSPGVVPVLEEVRMHVCYSRGLGSSGRIRCEPPPGATRARSKSFIACTLCWFTSKPTHDAPSLAFHNPRMSVSG